MESSIDAGMTPVRSREGYQDLASPAHHPKGPADRSRATAAPHATNDRAATRFAERVDDPSRPFGHCYVLSHPDRGRDAAMLRSLRFLQRQLGNRCVEQILTRADGPAAGSDLGAVERAIEQARGSGDALDDGVRGAMESSLKADFSAVRVHRDPRADALSRDIAARAFTTGHDIFFRHGEYDTGTPAGRELLVHELTHVVQQQNGAGVRRKLTVSEPADPLEVEADEAARAVTQQQARAASGAGPEDVTRTPSDASVRSAVPRRAQRLAETYPAPDWGSGGDSRVTFNPRAELTLDGGGGRASWFLGGNIDTMPVPRGSSGRITIFTDVFYYWNNGWFDKKSGMMSARGDALFTVSPDGKFEWLTDASTRGSGGVPGFLSFKPGARLQSHSDTDASIQLTTDLEAAGSIAKTSTWEFGGEAGGEVEAVGIKGTLKHGRGSGVTTMGSAHWIGDYMIHLTVPAAQPRPPITLPEVTIVKYGTTVHFKHPGSDVLEDGATSMLARWFVDMPAEARADLDAGEGRIVLVGHASTTGGNVFNLRLSARRTAEVKKKLQLVAPRLNESNFDIENQGEEKAGTANEVEDREERRVDVWITYMKGAFPEPKSGPGGAGATVP